MAGISLLVLAGAVGWWAWPSDSGRAASVAGPEPGMVGAKDSPATLDVPTDSPALDALETPAAELRASASPADPAVEAAPDVPEIPQHNVRVHVLDSAGNPASGVAVSLRRQHFLRDPHTVVSDWTDAAGDVVLHSRDLTKLAEGSANPLGRPALSVFAEIPMTSEVAVPVALPLETDHVYQLQLPPLGAVTVHLLGPDGEPFLEPARVSARWIPTVEVGTEVYGGYNRCHDAHRTTSTGSTRYEFVGADVSMTFSAIAPAYDNGFAGDVPITVEPGGNQEVTIQFGPRRPLVRCRVLAADGSPVADEEMKLRVWHDPESMRRRPFSNPFRAQTDEGGFFDFYFDREQDATYPRRLYVERLAGGTEARPPEDWSRGYVELPLRLSDAAQHDLGTVRLEPPELLQAGRVFDFNGEPASNARLSFIRETPGERINRNKVTYIGTIYTEDDGSFEFRAFERPPGMRVTLYDHVKIDGNSTRVYGEHQDLTVGDRSATYFLNAPSDSGTGARSTGSVPVSILLDADLPGEYFAIQLIHGKRKEEAIPLSVLGETPLPLKLEPGTWSIRVFLDGLDHDLVRIDGLEVVANETLSDARCLPIDLRGAAKRMRFPVQRSNGAPWRGKKLHVRCAQPPMEGKLRTGEDGMLNVAVPAECGALELSSDGETWTRVDVAEEDVVTLAEGS